MSLIFAPGNGLPLNTSAIVLKQEQDLRNKPRLQSLWCRLSSNQNYKNFNDLKITN